MPAAGWPAPWLFCHASGRIFCSFGRAWSAATKVEMPRRPVLDSERNSVLPWTTTGAASPDVSSPASTARQSPREFTDAGVDASGTGCINTCAVNLPRLDTAAVESLQVVSDEATGLALANYESFIQSSIAAMLKTGHRSGPSAMSMQRVDNAGM
jgi:hypothetical protein